jgi:CheY-specific phosphatase CheX
MRQEFVNPFLTAAQHVFEVELGQELKFSGPRVTEDTITSEDITAFIGVTGRLEGNVFYGFKRAVARSILTIMLEKPPAGMDQMALSALGKIANMITGNAAIGLAGAGFSTGLTPPTLIQPKGSKFTALGCPQIVVDLESECGPFPVRISLRKNEDQLAA